MRDLPKKKFRNMTWGVFKAYMCFFSECFDCMMPADTTQVVFKTTSQVILTRTSQIILTIALRRESLIRKLIREGKSGHIMMVTRPMAITSRALKLKSQTILKKTSVKPNTISARWKAYGQREVKRSKLRKPKLKITRREELIRKLIQKRKSGKRISTSKIDETIGGIH